ncbi:MAG: hypothetical protein IJ066_01535 [Bacteroidaceae bacterium]|nr:hypothetical protein [Bacteroidaceae bacterium]
MNFTKTIYQLYSDMGIKTKNHQSPIVYIEPIIPLSSEQEKKLKEGDGQSNPNEYMQINSSTGLAVNYYKILENTGKIKDLVFEDKVAIPLIKGVKPANLDVSYKRDGKIYYVESKFLEPYYSGNEHNRDSYFDTNRYDVPEKDKEDWLNLFSDAQKYKLFNFSQLCRHLMAIWRKHHEDKHFSFVFQSVTWRMSDQFINKLDDEELRESFISRRSAIEKESKECQQRIIDFLKKIGWNNLTFECLHYNDMLKDISSSSYLEEFKRRYFLE